jgi:hypothetical protein
MRRKTMGLFIDRCSTEQLERLVSAPEFSDGATWWSEPGMPPCGCLVGTALGGLIPWPLRIEAESTWRLWREVPEVSRWATAPASWRYPLAVGRFGIERVVRAVRLRAARRLQTTARDIEQLIGEPFSAGRAG